jgi:hypothetical protein
MYPPCFRRDFFRALGVGLSTLLVALWIYDLYTLAHWQSTLQYGGDTLEVLARIKIAAESGFDAWAGKPLERLGAPFDASWASYPQPDQLIIWLTGKLSLWLGLIPAAHVMMLAAHVLGAVIFFICARQLGHRALWAAAGGLLFGVCHFNNFRALAHYSFAFSFLLPAMLLIAWRIARSRRLEFTRCTLIVGTFFVIMLSAGNPYYTLFFLQLLAGALLFQFFSERRKTNLLAGAALGLGSVIGTLLWNCPVLWAQFQGGAGDPLVRSYAGNELYALKFIELFVPPAFHHFPVFADFGRFYAGSTSLRGEIYSAYLGIIPTLGFLLIIATGLRSLLRGRAGLSPSHFPWVIWLLLTGSVGGVQSVIALLGISYFRAGNRYSILILTLSLFFLVGWLSKHVWLNRHRWIAWSLCVGGVVLGLTDQITPRLPNGTRKAVAEKIASDMRFTTSLEKNLPAEALIFQLPAMPMLEQPTVVAMTDYALFRPFLFSHTLRFSYGSLVKTPEANWARWAGNLPPQDMVAMLQSAGFHAVCINRLAYKDRAASLVKSFADIGYPVDARIALDPEHVVISLQPAPAPTRPDLRDTRLLLPWDPLNTRSQLPLYASRGWFDEGRDGNDIWRWAGRASDLTVYNPRADIHSATLRFGFRSYRPGTLTLFFKKTPIWSAPISSDSHLTANVPVELPPGSSVFTWKFDGRLALPSSGDTRRLGFNIRNLEVLFEEGSQR